jgi:hypothetical protein
VCKEYYPLEVEVRRLFSCAGVFPGLRDGCYYGRDVTEQFQTNHGHRIRSALGALYSSEGIDVSLYGVYLAT